MQTLEPEQFFVNCYLGKMLQRYSLGRLMMAGITTPICNEREERQLVPRRRDLQRQ